MEEDGIIQHLRNQIGDGIEDLYAYSQLLLAISGVDGRYGTTDTKKKFWSSWREETIPEAERSQVKAKPLCAAQRAVILADRPSWALEDCDRFYGAEVLVTGQDRLLISLLRPDGFMDFTRRFLFFDRKLAKIAARYQQVQGAKAKDCHPKTANGDSLTLRGLPAPIPSAPPKSRLHPIGTFYAL